LGQDFVAGERGIVFFACELGFVAELALFFLFCFALFGFCCVFRSVVLLSKVCV
jgi:hypothetical protein